MSIKIFTGVSEKILEEEINDFIKDGVKKYDIKFQVINLERYDVEGKGYPYFIFVITY